MCLLREPHSESWLKETVLKKDKDKIQCVCERERDHCLVLCPLSSAVPILIIWTHPLQIKKDRHTHPHTPLITLCHRPKNACPRALILKETQSLESDTALCLLLWSSVCILYCRKMKLLWSNRCRRHSDSRLVIYRSVSSPADLKIASPQWLHL